MKAKISIPTAIIAKFKRNKEPKLAYFEDIYEIDNVPVVNSEDKNVYDTGVYGYFVCDENLFFSLGDFFLKSETKDEIKFSVATGDYGIFLFSHYVPENIFPSFEKIDGVQEIIYDERKEIESKLQLAKKDFVLVKKDKNTFRLFVNFNLPHNNIHNNPGTLNDHIKLLFNGEINILNKNTYVPTYMAHEVLKQFVLYSVRMLLSENSFEFNDLNIAIKQKLNQVELMEIIKKHYEDDIICKTVDFNISTSLYNHKSLKKEFVIEFIDFYKQNYNLSQETRDNAEYLLEKCYGENLAQNFDSEIKI